MSSRLVLIALFALLVTNVFAQRLPRNSFIMHRCNSVPELVAEVRNNPEVMDRFCRHFAMSREDVVRYISSLHVSRLRRTGVYTVYSIPPDGRLKMHAEKIYEGTPIFADMNDTPVMLVKCGNPLTLGPAIPRAEVVVPAAAPVAPMREEAVVGEVAPAPPVFPAPTPVAPVLVAAPPVAAVHVAGGAVFPWPLLLLPLGFIHTGGGCGSCGSCGTCGSPVPEPTSLLVFAVGAAALWGRRKFANR